MSRRSILVSVVVAAFCCLATIAEAAPEQECRFTYRPLAVGDQAHETHRFTLDLKTIRSQNGQVVDVADHAAVRSETSLVLRLPTGQGETAKVRITYESSEQTSQSRVTAPQQTDRPVAGKTYIGIRRGEDLVITDEAGNEPPDDERDIVARSLDSLGKPNPLGTFFHGRTLQLGQRVQLPAEYTKKLLAGWDESLADRPLEVILMGTERVDGKLCALLHTPPAAGGQKSPVDGKFLIELETCRVAKVDLRGPVASQERLGAPGEEFDVRRKGKLQVALHVEHLRAR
jgi:hypothetical protein